MPDNQRLMKARTNKSKKLTRIANKLKKANTREEIRQALKGLTNEELAKLGIV